MWFEAANLCEGRNTRPPTAVRLLECNAAFSPPFYPVFLVPRPQRVLEFSEAVEDAANLSAGVDVMCVDIFIPSVRRIVHFNVHFFDHQRCYPAKDKCANASPLASSFQHRHNPNLWHRRQRPVRVVSRKLYGHLAAHAMPHQNHLSGANFLLQCSLDVSSDYCSVVLFFLPEWALSPSSLIERDGIPTACSLVDEWVPRESRGVQPYTAASSECMGKTAKKRPPNIHLTALSERAHVSAK